MCSTTNSHRPYVGCIQKVPQEQPQSSKSTRHDGLVLSLLCMFKRTSCFLGLRWSEQQRVTTAGFCKRQNVAQSRQYDVEDKEESWSTSTLSQKAAVKYVTGTIPGVENSLTYMPACTISKEETQCDIRHPPNIKNSLEIYTKPRQPNGTLCEAFATALKILFNFKSTLDEPWDISSSTCHCVNCSERFGSTHRSIIEQLPQNAAIFSNNCWPKVLPAGKEAPRIIAGYPYGWIRIALKLSPSQKAATLRWHLSYHGTTKEAAVSIVKDRQLKPPDNVLIWSRPFHASTNAIYSTPSVKYASFVTYATPFKFEEKEEHWWQVVMEVRHRPGSYRLHPQTLIQGHYLIDPNIDNAKLAWKSFDSKNTLVTALLIRSFTGVSERFQKAEWSDLVRSNAAGMPSNKFSHNLLWWQPWDGSPPLTIGLANDFDRLTGKCGCDDCYIKQCK